MTAFEETEWINREVKDELERSPIKYVMDNSYEERNNHHSKRDRSRSRSPVRRSDRSRSRSRSKSPSGERRRIVSNVSSNKVIIRNIPYETPWQELKDLFRKEVGSVIYVELFKGNDGRPNGMGVVEFRDREMARTAIEKMNKHVLMGRAIIVREERESDKRMYSQNTGGPPPMGGGGGGGPPMGGGPMSGGPMGGPMGGGGHGMGMGGGGGMGTMMGGGGGGGTAGISPQILQQLGIEGPVTNSVFVANLDYKVTWQKLKDVFKLAGKVLKAEIKTDKTGKSRGMGTVLFEHPMEAVQAISMFNGQSLFDRTMSVKIDNLDTERASPQQSKLPSGLKSIGMGLGSGGIPLQNISQGYNSGGGGGGGMGGGSMGMGGGMGNMGGGMGGGMGNMGGTYGMDTSGMSGLGMDSGMGGMSGMGGGMSGMGGTMSGMGGGMGGGMTNNPIGNMNNMGVGLGSGMTSGMVGGMGTGMGGMGRTANLGMTSSNMGMGIGTGGMGLGGGESFNMGNMGSDRGGMGMMDRSRMDNYSDRDRGRRDDRERSSGSLADKGFTTKPDNATVVVKNLPYSTQWKALKERFADVGEVRFSEIKMENGRSTGTGLIRFATQADAERAINVMHKTMIDGREVTVRMYR